MKKSFLFFFGIVFTCCFAHAQLQVSQPKESELGDRRHRATIRMESATLCPGQEVELGIYVDLLLGKPGGGSGTYTPEQLPPDPLDNFMFYFYISDTSAAEVVCSSTEHRSPTYRVGYPVLSDKMPELAGGSLTCGYIEGSDSDLGKRGRFTCIWVRSRPSVKLIPTIERPLFKIRVRLKKAVPVTISIDDPNEIAFSTGLAQMGGYYYSFYNEPNSIPNRIPGKLTVDKGPDKATITAGPDSVVCIGERVFFNAEGGKSYRWSQCYNPGIAGGYNYEHLSNVNTKNPTFYPLHSGPYLYQVEVFDERGCSTRDTVFYYVQNNYLQSITVDPNNTMVDSGSRVKFRLKGSANNGALGRLKVIMEPDSLFPEGVNMLWANEEAGYNKGLTVEGSLLTKPIYEPTLLVATLQDTACSTQTSASICINGIGVTGKIAPFPVYRCGEDRALKSLQLNLLTHGGSNNFLYNWHAVDLEFTQFPGAAPKIDNPNLRSPKITYYGRFAVSVDIYDMVTGETVTISDTVIKREWLTAETRVVLDTLSLLEEGLNVGGPYCDGTVLKYKARSVNAGKDARYIWQVNNVWKEEGINDTVFSADLYKGDSVQCVLYSTEACVRNMAAESKPFSPDIRRPVTPTIEIVNRDMDGLDFCGVELQAVCREVGKIFRLQWLRNGEVELDTIVRAEDPDYDTVNVSFERRGFYDGFSCRLTESDMPCGIMDTIVATVPTEAMPPGQNTDFSDIQTVYPLSASDALPKVGPVRMDASLVCSTSPFTLTAQVENLTENFELRWYRKQAGDSVLLGCYRYPYNPNQVDDYILWGESVYGYNSGQSKMDIPPAFKDGFKIILNDPNAAVNERKKFSAGDTVFYVLLAEYEGYFCNPVDKETLVLRSPYFVPRVVAPADPDVLTVEYVEGTHLCPGTGHPYHLAANMGGDAAYRLEWSFEGYPVTDEDISEYFNLLGSKNDTLECLVVIKPEGPAGIWGACTATITEGCNAGHTQTAEFNFNEYVLDAPRFRIRHSEDTIVCADQPVEHWAQVAELSNTSAASEEELLSANTKEYTISWARSPADLESSPEATGSTFGYTPTPNGNTPDGTGSFEDNRGIFATYIKAKETSSGCEVVDSVLVMVAHPYKVAASIEYILPDTWCDSSDYVKEDKNRKVEGIAFMPGVQYAVMHIENGGSRPFIEWSADGETFGGYNLDTLNMMGAPDGDTLRAMVRSSMYTCLSDTAQTNVLPIRTSRRGQLYADAPESAIAGEPVNLRTYVGAYSHSWETLNEYSYTYSMQKPDGSWEQLAVDHRPQMPDFYDSLLVPMPSHTGRFRIESHDKYNVCPVQTEDMDVTLAVSTNISMRVFDPLTRREIKGLCPQSYSFVYADGQPAPQDNQAGWVNGTREPMDVFIRTYPENATGEAFVVYYKNGALVAVGPVGTKPLSFDPKDGFGDCRVLERGDTITEHILPGEWFGAMYVHDTVSIDGKSIHQTDRITLNAIDTVGKLVVTASPSAVCSGETTTLSAAFEKAEASVTWYPQGACTPITPNQAEAVVRQTSVYSAVAVDPNGCPWIDSVRVNEVTESVSLPLGIHADSLRFCGRTARLRISIDTKQSQADAFEMFYVYSIEQTDNRLIDSTKEAFLDIDVTDGMRVMVQGRTTLSCQRGLSQSDTVRFSGFGYPVLNRLQPVAADTVVCPLSDVTIAYGVQPAGALMRWYVELDGYSEILEDVAERFDYVADENARFIVTAQNADMPVCATIDTVTVRISTSDTTSPQIALNADRTEICGEQTVTYTAVAHHHDRILWFANGQLLDETSTTLVRVPRITGFDGPADSVCAWALRSQTGCLAADTAKARPAVVWRVEKPELSLSFRDTTVYENDPVALQAHATVYDGPEPVIMWMEAESEDTVRTDRYEVTHSQKGSYLYYVGAMQLELAEVLPECYSYDSVSVTVREKVGTETAEENLVHITPNPTSGRFTVQTSVPCSIEIFSLSGTRVWFSENARGRIPVSLHVSGVYFVRAVEHAGNRISIQKLIVR